MKDCSIMIDGRKFFDQPIKNDIRTNDNIRKTAMDQGGDYSTSCLLDYPHFKENYKLITTGLSKQQSLDADPKAIQRISFIGNLKCAGNATMFFVIEEVLLRNSHKELRKYSKQVLRILFDINIK